MMFSRFRAYRCALAALLAFLGLTAARFETARAQDFDKTAFRADALERLSAEDRKLADSLMTLALDREALYTLWGDLKPISDVAFFTFPVARAASVPQGAANAVEAGNPALRSISRLQNVVNAMNFGDLQFFVHPFKRADSGRRYLQVAVLRKSAVAACVRRNQAFFGHFGFVPESDPVSVVMATEYEDKYDRYRAYGYLYGYPEHAVTFFVEAARAQDSTKEFVKRDFFQIPVWSGKQGHFVYAVPKGYAPADIDSAIYNAAAVILEQYRAIRPQFMNADSSLRAVELLRAWHDNTLAPLQNRASRRQSADMAILWAQSAEAKALSLQAYALAQERLQAALKNAKNRSKKNTKPLAVVVDIDETILDNSPFSAHARYEPFSRLGAAWLAWERRAVAAPLPGAVEFLRFAEKNGVTTFYLSNRSERYKELTLQNLRAAGFPVARDEQLLLRSFGSDSAIGARADKEPRRRFVAQQYDVALFIGDNLADFAEEFEYKSAEERMNATLKARAAWGKRFIVLPNAMYGQWEDALYDYRTLSDEARAARREELLRRIAAPARDGKVETQ
jgi:5'-nucleotidase (lipoprotein e(P4) family)